MMRIRDMAWLPQPGLIGSRRVSETATASEIAPTLKQLPGRDVFFGGQARPKYRYPEAHNLINRLIAQGEDPSSAGKVIFKVSGHFSPDGQSRDYTYGQLLEDTRRVAAGYRKKGLAGKRIAVAETNSLELLSTYYGGLAVGATMVPLNLLTLLDKGTKNKNLTHMLAGPGCDALMVGQDSMFKEMRGLGRLILLKKSALRWVARRYMEGKPARTPLELVIFAKLDAQFARDLTSRIRNYESEKGAPASAKEKARIKAEARADFKVLYEGLPSRLKVITPAAKVKLKRSNPLNLKKLVRTPDPDSMADIIFTSGTSGAPKGVALTHRNMVFTADSLEEGLKDILKPNDVMLLGLPLFHIFGKAILLAGMNTETPMVMLPSLSEAIRSLGKVAETIREEKVTVLPAVPLFLEKFVAYAQTHPEAQEAIRQLRVVVSGGAALTSEVYKAFKAMNPDLRIIEGYGSSEGGINMLNKSGIRGYVGEALPGVEVKMIESDPNHAFHGYSMSGGQGEILVRSPGVSPGYVKGTVPADSETRVPDKDGWYHTGDQGRREWVLREGAQEGEFGSKMLGPMQIMGRDSNFIKDAGGERRDPVEFENALKQADSRVKDAMAIPYKPNRETEKSVVLVVSPEASVSEASIKEAMSAAVQVGRIPGALVPKHIVVLRREALPEAFQNEFKREAAYKAVRDFVNQAVDRELLILQDKFGTEREKTVVPDGLALEAFAESYRFTGNSA